MNYRYYIVISSIMIFCQNASSINVTQYMPSIPFLSKKQQEITMQKEYTVEEPCIINIVNKVGDIYIKTEWNQDKVSVKATKRAGNKDHFSNMHITQKVTAHSVTLQSQINNNVKGSIDYTLIVPAKANLELSTEQGCIKVREANGRITATTESGDIEINQATQPIIVQTKKQGSIKISSADSDIQAHTQKGNIIITDAHRSVSAYTNHGYIEMKSKNVPALSQINLATQTGTIDLQLPSCVNAELKAKTEKGMVLCQLPITFKPFTTILDANTWRHFKERVNGTLGTGEARIVLHTKKGNIKISDIQVS